MLIRFKKRSDVASSEITPKAIFDQRRKFLKTAAVAGAGAAFGSIGGAAFPAQARGAKLDGVVKSKWTQESLGLDLSKYDDVTMYNNFYEFGTPKEAPSRNSKKFKPLPWTVAVDGMVEHPGIYDFEDLIKPHQLQERVYRFRCVEAWSMVVPWVGFPLADVVKRLAPTGGAKYIAFETLHDAKRMPGQRRAVLNWPYREGLRLDEAMNPLSLLVVGLYGEVLPNQNGAPIRLITPWKYGFKSIKSIVRMSFTDLEPPTSWNMAAPREYGFYSNVNPNVDHPRWSQFMERVIGGGFFAAKQPTLMFNGYEEEVGQMYAGMDIKKNY